MTRLRQVLLPRDSQPQEAVGVDWDSPFFRDARAVFAAFGEAVTGTPPIAGAGTIARTTGRSGIAYDFAAGNVAIEFPAVRYVPPPFTAIFVANKSSAATDALIGFGGYGGGGGWVIQCVSGIATDARITYGGVADYAPISGFFKIGEDAVYAVSVSASTARFFRNGLFIGSAAVGTPNITTRPLAIGAGYNASYSGFSTSKIYGGGIFGAALSDAQVFELSANPWQLFAPQRLFAPFYVTSVGPLLSALEAYNITSSTAKLRVTLTF